MSRSESESVGVKFNEKLNDIIRAIGDMSKRIAQMENNENIIKQSLFEVHQIANDINTKVDLFMNEVGSSTPKDVKTQTKPRAVRKKSVANTTDANGTNEDDGESKTSEQDKQPTVSNKKGDSRPKPNPPKARKAREIKVKVEDDSNSQKGTEVDKKSIPNNITTYFTKAWRENSTDITKQLSIDSKVITVAINESKVAVAKKKSEDDKKSVVARNLYKKLDTTQKNKLKALLDDLKKNIARNVKVADEVSVDENSEHEEETVNDNNGESHNAITDDLDDLDGLEYTDHEDE